MYLEPKVVLQHLIEPRTSGRRETMTDTSHRKQEVAASPTPFSLSRAQLVSYSVQFRKALKKLNRTSKSQGHLARWH